MVKLAKQPDGAAVTRWLDRRTLEVTFEGQITQPLVEQLLKDFFSVTADQPAKYVLFDAVQGTGFSPAARAGALRFLAEFKARGGKEIIAVVNHSAIRMLGQALTFASGLPLKMFTAREQAMAYIVSKLRED